jgi:hypothetical protein
MTAAPILVVRIALQKVYVFLSGLQGREETARMALVMAIADACRRSYGPVRPI